MPRRDTTVSNCSFPANFSEPPCGPESDVVVRAVDGRGAGTPCRCSPQSVWAWVDAAKSVVIASSATKFRVIVISLIDGKKSVSFRESSGWLLVGVQTFVKKFNQAA